MCLLNNYVILLKEVFRIGSSQDQKFSVCIVSDYLYESKKSVRFNSLSGWQNFPCYHTVLIQMIEFCIDYLKSLSGGRKWVTGEQYVETWKYVKERYWTKSCSVKSALSCAKNKAPSLVLFLSYQVTPDKKEVSIHKGRRLQKQSLDLYFPISVLELYYFHCLNVIKPIWMTWKTHIPLS